MTRFQDLPTELRLYTLEYVVCSFAWLDPPDVDALQADDWYYPPRPLARRIHPVIWFAHRKTIPDLLKSLFLVSKDFQMETKYVWKKLVEPRLTPILNIDCVGHGTNTYRPLTGMLVKWLCLPTSFVHIDMIEVRIRCCDQELIPDGGRATLFRPVPRQIPSPKGLDLLSIGFRRILHRLRQLKLPGLADRHPNDAFAGIKTLRLVFETALPDGLHWTHSPNVRYKDPGISVPISLHPYFTSMEVARSIYQTPILHKHNRIPLERCEVYMDECLVLRFHCMDRERVVDERFPYNVPVDPLCVP